MSKQDVQDTKQWDTAAERQASCRNVFAKARKLPAHPAKPGDTNQRQRGCDPSDNARDNPIVELHTVSKSFRQRQRTGLFRHETREIHALDGVNLTLKKGEFAAYAGPNGAGKSTTFKLLCGLLAPDAGAVSVMGADPMRERVRLMNRIGVLFGGRTELWWDHPVIRSFEWKRDVWNIPQDVYHKNVEKYVDLLDLKPFLNSFVRELSLGQRMRADLAMMLLHSPELILLDEPTLGLDVLAKRRIIDCLRQLNKEDGATILVTSHDMDDLTSMASRLILLSQGRIAFDGTSAELLRRTGDKRTLCITCDGSAPEIACAAHLRSELNQHFYAFDGSDAPQVLAGAGQLPGLRDAEITHAPIEEVIAGLYATWQEKA